MLNRPNKVILHCAQTPDNPFQSTYDIKDVDRWHKERGYDGVGYHEFVKRDGIIQSGRPYEIVGAHCFGENKDSLGYCYEGTYLPSMPQIDAFITLFKKAYLKYGIKATDWHGHNEFTAKKTCPGFDMDYLRLILRSIELYYFDDSTRRKI